MSDQAHTHAQRPEQFPFTEWQFGVEDAANRLTSRVKHRARSTFEHLRKAWRLLGHDNEMSAFRAITAEEEAATALILALQMQGYPGARRLNPRNHIHKNAFWPLFEAINRVLAQSGFPPPKVLLPREGPPHVQLRFNLTAMAGREGEPVWIEPDHPLNFAMRVGQVSEDAVHLFDAELADLASEAGDHSIMTHVKRRANFRNRLLYAEDSGIPGAKLSDDTLRAHAQRSAMLIIVAIMIMQTDERQLFAVQCLEGLLRAIDKFEGLVFDYSEAQIAVDRPVLSITRIGAEPGQLAICRPLAPQEVWWGAFGFSRAGPRAYSLNLSYSTQ